MKKIELPDDLTARDRAQELLVTLACGDETATFTVTTGFGPVFARLLQGAAKAMDTPVVAVRGVDRDGAEYPLSVLVSAAGSNEATCQAAAKAAVSAYNSVVGRGGSAYLAAPFDPKGRKWRMEARAAAGTRPDDAPQEDTGAMRNTSTAGLKPKFRKEF